MKAIYGAKITIENPTKKCVDFFKEKLTISNPEYHKKLAMGKFIGKTPKNLYLFEKNGNKLIIPYGMKRYVEQSSITDIEYESQRPASLINYKSRIKLFDYQERALNSVISSQSTNGVIVAPCGAGKTQMALELVSELKGKTLWITHTQDLMNQSMERAKANFDIDYLTYGTITAGKVNIGSGLTFATVQTLCKIDLKRYENEFDVIIVDECHKVVGTPTNIMMFYKCLSNLNAKYKIGVTATPKRADGLEQCMFSLIGDVIHEITLDEVEQNTSPVRVLKRETHYTPDYSKILSGDGTIIYSSLLEDLISNENRNNEILRVLEIIYGMKSPCLVLSDRIAHLDILGSRMGEFGANVRILKGNSTKKSKEERKNALSQLNDGDVDIVFATYKLAKEGLDIPNLQYVVFASPQKDETTVVQSAGRVARKSEGKQMGTVIDFIDNFGLLKGYSKKRDRYYKRLKYNIEEWK